MPNKTLLPALTVVVVCTACGPLVPLSYIKGKIDNQPVQTIETTDATIWLQYLRKQYGNYIFDLEVENHSQHAMLFAPQHISFYASPNAFTLANDSTDVHTLSYANSSLTMRRQFANSPGAIEEIYYKKVKAKRAGTVLFAILGAGLAIYDAAKDSEDSKKETWTKEDERKSLGRDFLVSAALSTADIASASADQAMEESMYVPYELFPECSIQPGKNIRGKIFIPIDASYRYSRVIIPLGGVNYVFDFKRRGVKKSN